MRADLLAIRRRVAFASSAHFACLSVEGPGAFATLDRVCCGDLFLQDGQTRHTLMLRPDATPLADVYVARDGERYYVLAEGPSPDGLRRHLAAHAQGELRVADLGETHVVLSVHGPFAWELLAEAIGPDVLGLPYLCLLATDGLLCFRGGKTGEFGFDLVVPNGRATEVRAALDARAETFEARWVDQPALDQCALENWFFDIRRTREPGLTPLELQLQWRVSPDKRDYVGAGALAERRAAGPTHRVTCVVAEHDLLAGAPVTFERTPIGHIMTAGRGLGPCVAWALLERPYAHAGIDRYRVSGERVRTVAPPVVDNHSLHVNPYQHTFHALGEIDLPT